jgi:CRP-like cAMP-binding protein
LTKQVGPEGHPDPKANRLLAELAPAEYNALMAHARIVPFKLGKAICNQGDKVDAVYFPITCMVSLLVGTSRREMVETATIGKEGVICVSELLQNEHSMGFYIIQLPGFALRVTAVDFDRLLQGFPHLKRLADHHTYSLLRQILQGAACNRLHSMEERCARWLLMTHDRAGADTFPLTQEFLSNMLAVRRATVNVATGMLKKAGFIRYTRGQMTVSDRRGLESATCECYRAVWRGYDYTSVR